MENEAQNIYKEMEKKKKEYQAFKSDQMFGTHLFLVVLLKTSYRHLIFSTCQSSHAYPLKITKHNTDIFLIKYTEVLWKLCP